MSKELICDNLTRQKNVIEYDLNEPNFRLVQAQNKPALFNNCLFGPCSVWDLSKLSSKLEDEEIVIHESANSKLDFMNKNFTYRTCPFSEFSKILRENDSDKNVYMRSINRNPRFKKPARIEVDFPMLKDDLIHMPQFIPYNDEDGLYQSSVLRIASKNVQVWTHFDMYDNILIQTVGTKRVILIPPEDTKYLYVEGDKSPVNEFDDLQACSLKYPLIQKSQPYICTLKPTQALFIPALWWHNIKTIDTPGSSSSEKYSIGFNIFWKDPILHSKSMYADKDVYGNKNLPLFDSALANLGKAICHIEKLPNKYQLFYRYMLLNQLRCKLFPESKEMRLN